MKAHPAIVRLTSLEHEGLNPYRTLRRQEEHLREGIFVAEGEKVVRRLMASGLDIRSMLLTPEWFSTLFPEGPAAPGTALIPAGAQIFLAEKKLLESIVGFTLHQGIMAVGMTPPEPSPAGSLQAGRGRPALCVALDDLVNAENVGLAVRNCAAFGVDLILCGETSGSPYLRRAVRSSMGTVFDANVVHSRDLSESLLSLRRDFGAVIIAADPAGTCPLYDTDLTVPVCVVLGHEGRGIRRKILEVCDTRVAIPMWSATDSLNVSSACAVFLWEARRQRRAKA
jgi:tRNA G18 (ribose-2'-O)-methylase SpoU